MKKLLLLTALAISNLLMAKTITVDNTILSTAMYTDLQTAIDEAEASDIVLIKGGGASYGSITLSKRLTLIGEGYESQGKIRRTAIDLMQFGSKDAEGSTFKSLQVDVLSRISGLSDDINSISLINCEIPNRLIVYGELWKVNNCNMGADINNQSYQVTYTNCFVSGLAFSSSATSSPSTSYTNCTFRSSVISSLHNARFTNCIFNNAFDGQFCTIDNCLFKNEKEVDILADNNTLSNNIYETDPLFQTTSGTGAYQLSTASPAKGVGKDGTDIGMTGGKSPLKELTGENNLPQVTRFIVETGVITPGAPLKLKFTAKKKVK